MDLLTRYKALFWKEWQTFKRHRALQLLIGLIAAFGLLVGLSEGKSSPALTITFTPGGDSDFKSYLVSIERDTRFRYAGANAKIRPRGNEVIVSLPENIRSGSGVILARHSSRSPVAGLAARQILYQRAFEFLQLPVPVEIRVLDENGTPTELTIPRPPERTATDARATRDITMVLLSTIAIMMCGLNLFSVVLSEEKANKLLLVQLLSPAGLTDLILAKMAFNMLICALLECIVLCTYRPGLLMNLYFWTVVILGITAYMSVASIIVMISKKPSTANILTMGYVLLIGMVILLAQDLSLFGTVKELLPEMYLFTSLAHLFDGRLEVPMLDRFAYSSGFLFLSALTLAHFRGIRAS